MPAHKIDPAYAELAEEILQHVRKQIHEDMRDRDTVVHTLIDQVHGLQLSVVNIREHLDFIRNFLETVEEKLPKDELPKVHTTAPPPNVNRRSGARQAYLFDLDSLEDFDYPSPLDD